MFAGSGPLQHPRTSIAKSGDKREKSGKPAGTARARRARAAPPEWQLNVGALQPCGGRGTWPKGSPTAAQAGRAGHAPFSVPPASSSSSSSSSSSRGRRRALRDGAAPAAPGPPLPVAAERAQRLPRRDGAGGGGCGTAAEGGREGKWREGGAPGQRRRLTQPRGRRGGIPGERPPRAPSGCPAAGGVRSAAPGAALRPAVPTGGAVICLPPALRAAGC